MSATKALVSLHLEAQTATEADVLAGTEGKLVTADVIAPLLGQAVPNEVVEAAVEQYFIDNPASGDVTGPSSSTNDRIAVFSGTSGKVIKQGPVLGDGALLDIGTGANTLAAGDDARFDEAVQKDANGADFEDVNAVRENLGIAADAESITIGVRKHITKHQLPEPTGGDDTAMINAAFGDYAGVWEPLPLRFGQYRISSQIQLPAGGGLVCDKGEAASFLMLTGAGKFDNAAHATRYATDAAAFKGAANSKLLNIAVQMEAAASVRVLTVFEGTSEDDPEIEDIEMYGFHTGSLIAIRGSNAFRVRNIYAHDCGHDFGGLAGGFDQFTIVEIDNARPSVSQNGLIENIKMRDVVMGATAIAAYGGVQVDAVNLQAVGQYSGHTIRGVDTEGAGDVLDIWSSGNLIRDIRAKDTVNFVAKVLYGASDNDGAGIYSDGCGLATIYVANSTNSLANGRVWNNKFRGLTLLKCGKGRATLHPSIASQAAIQIEGASGSDQDKRPAFNTFEGYIEANSSSECPTGLFGTNMGEGNRGRLKVIGTSEDTVSLHSDRAYRVENTRPVETFVHATLVNNATLNNGDILPFDTEVADDCGEYVTGSAARFTPKVPGRYRLDFEIRVVGVTAGTTFGVQVRKNGSQYKLMQRISVGGDDCLSGSVVIDMNTRSNPADSGSAPDYADIRLIEGNTGSVIVSGIATVTWLQIARVP